MSEILSIFQVPFLCFKICVNNEKTALVPGDHSLSTTPLPFQCGKYTPVAEKCQAGRAQFLSADFTEFSADPGKILFLTCAKPVVYYIHGFLIGKMIDSLIIGILCLIAMSILKLPYALLLSLIVCITNMIPYFGPIIGAIPGVMIYLFIDIRYAFIFAPVSYTHLTLPTIA